MFRFVEASRCIASNTGHCHLDRRHALRARIDVCFVWNLETDSLSLARFPEWVGYALVLVSLVLCNGVAGHPSGVLIIRGRGRAPPASEANISHLYGSDSAILRLPSPNRSPRYCSDFFHSVQNIKHCFTLPRAKLLQVKDNFLAFGSGNCSSRMLDFSPCVNPKRHHFQLLVKEPSCR